MKTTLQFAVLMAATMAMGPFAIDVYLPAFPVISADLGVAESQVALTLSLFIFGLAFGQIVGGPLSDRYGRAPVLLTGLFIYAATALMVAASQNLSWMISWRVIMAFGSGWIMVSVPALVRDNAHGKEAARLFSLIALIMFIAPALAPSLGSLLLWLGDWSLIFWFIAAYCILVGVLLWFKLLRHLPKRDSKHEPVAKLLTNYVQVLLHPIAWKHIVIQALGFSVLMLFVTHASFMYQGWFGLNNAQFSAAFATGVGLMGVMGIINRRLLLTYTPVQLLKIAVGLQLAALVVMNILLAFNSTSLWSFLPMMVIVGGTVGAIAPNNQAAYLEYFSQLSGTASALIGALQFIVSGTITTLSTLLVDGSITRITLAMLLICVPTCLATLSLPRAETAPQSPPA
ncbi:multidrug effflux MFS transporter [Saccharospirillum mangrovi]|uniref:multidrug effflux MFS transporter n=1 Tax=Saccharospirillum mangrovi TaxID=2161747 RepID=UPI000D336F52|nr:multidrug effflux MFS transporter [Saccharospirillum mangrovi]